MTQARTSLLRPRLVTVTLAVVDGEGEDEEAVVDVVAPIISLDG